MYYIYALLDTRKPGLYKYGEFEFDYEPFYIGKGRGKRFRTTLNKRGQNYKKKIIISGIKKAGLDVLTIFLYDNIEDESIAYDIERNLIKIIGRSLINQGPLSNICAGGKYDKDTLDKVKMVNRNRRNSEETRLKISLANKGRIKTEEEKLKLSESHKGKKLSDETKLKLSVINSVPKPKLRKEFEVVSPDGLIYKTAYLEEFCKEHDLNYNSMTALARGKRKSDNHKNWKCKKL